MKSIKEFKIVDDYEFYKQYFMEYCKKTNISKLKTIDLSNLTIQEKKEKVKYFINELLGFIPLELSCCSVNHYGNKTSNKLMVRISWLNRQRAFEDDDNIFPIGYLLKACINEVFGMNVCNGKSIKIHQNQSKIL